MRARHSSPWRRVLLTAVVVLMAVTVGAATGWYARPVTTFAAAREVRDAQLVTPNTGWALTRTRLARTDDGGTTWSTITPVGVDPRAIRDVHFIDATRGWLVAAGALSAARQATELTLHRTTNGGVTWLPSIIGATRFGAPGSIYLHFADPRVGYVNVSLEGSPSVGPSQLFVTRDAGLTWADSPSPARGRVGGSASLSWIAGGPGGFTRLYASVDTGTSWSRVAVPLAPTRAGSSAIYGRPLSINATEAIVPVSFSGDKTPGVGFYVTRDSGTTWTLASDVMTPTLVSEDVPVATAIPNDATFIAVLPRGNVAYVIEAGTPRTIQTLGLAPGVFEVWFPTPSVGWAITFAAGPERGRLFATADGARTWRELAP